MQTAEFVGELALLTAVAAVLVVVVRRRRGLKVQPARGLGSARLFAATSDSASEAAVSEETSDFLILQPGPDLTGAQVQSALEAAVAPIALQVRPLAHAERAGLELAPISRAIQSVIRDVALRDRPAKTTSEGTLYRAILPEGLELAHAKGGGLRGFARDDDGIAAHARLLPVPEAAFVTKTPLPPQGKVLAIAVVLAVSVVQAKVRADRQTLALDQARQLDDDAMSERLATLRAADRHLSETIAKLLDGHVPHTALELSRVTAGERLERARHFVKQAEALLDRIKINKKGSAAPRDVVRAFAGRSNGVEGFAAEVALARAAVDLSRKSALADAAGAALDDQANAYDTYRRQLDERMRDIDEVSAGLDDVSQRLRTLPIGRRGDRRSAIADAQRACLAAAGEEPTTGPTSNVFLELPTGEIQRVINGDQLFEQPPSATP